MVLEICVARMRLGDCTLYFSPGLPIQVAGQNAVLEVGKRVEEVHILIDGAMCSICLDPIQRNLRGLRLPCGSALWWT